jgi:hypothetical protein
MFKYSLQEAQEDSPVIIDGPIAEGALSENEPDPDVLEDERSGNDSEESQDD